MALIDEVKARFGTQYLVNLSNPYLETGTTIDETRLGKACTDVEADIETFAGVEFDLTDARYVSLAIAGVELKLLIWNGVESSSKWDAFVNDKLENGLALVTVRVDAIGRFAAIVIAVVRRPKTATPTPMALAARD